MNPIRVAVIIGSMRDGRLAPQLAEWFVAQARQRSDLTLDVIDLLQFPLPASLDDSDPAVAELRPRLMAADAFVLVVGEYNRSVPGPLKLAIDTFNQEWQVKPIGFVSYGLSIAGGVRAVEHLRQIFAEFHAVTMKDVVAFPRVLEHFEDGRFAPDVAASGAAVKVLLDQLTWWAWALRDAKALRPYGN